MKRNCLFILVDCLRADMCWGNSRTARTPTIDSLRQRGTNFVQAIATTSSTSPSVASALTGLYPVGHGVNSVRGYELNSSVKTLAQVLSKNGYHTYAEVTGPLIPQLGINRGFDHYHYRDKLHNVYSPWYDDILTKFAGKQFLEPYFLFLHFFELHGRRQVAEGYDKSDFGKNRYERALSSLDVRLGKLLSYVNDNNTVIVLHADHGEKIPETMGEKLISRAMPYYWILNRVLTRISGKSLAFLPFARHGFHIYDYLIRVPLVFVGRGIFPQDNRILDQVRQVDIFPTIIEALGLEQASIRTHGRTLMPLVRGQRCPEVPAQIQACGLVLRNQSRWLAGLRTPKWKYVFAPYSRDIRDELYDLENDPAEKNNLALKRPHIARELRQQLQEIRKADEASTVQGRIQGLKAQGKI